MSYSLFSVDHHPHSSRPRRKRNRLSRAARAAEVHAVLAAPLRSADRSPSAVAASSESSLFRRLWSLDLVDRLKPTLTRYHE